jgi:hypothetical protein
LDHETYAKHRKPPTRVPRFSVELPLGGSPHLENFDEGGYLKVERQHLCAGLANPKRTVK